MRPRIVKTLAEVIPIRPREGMSKAHEGNVSRLPCLCCGREEPHVTVDPHHLQRGLPADQRGMSRRAADRFLIPLCRECHRVIEATGDDEAELMKRGIVGRDIAHALWINRDNPDRMRNVVENDLNRRRFAVG